MTADAETAALRWLLLIHQIPPKPDYLRVKIGRRLQRIGAVPVKNSVYVLPDSDQSFEDFQWTRIEIIDGGGDASICRAEFIDGLTSDQIRHLFHEARDADYAAIAAGARELGTIEPSSKRSAARGRGSSLDDVAKLRKRLAAIAVVDFFEAPGRAKAVEAIDALEAKLKPPTAGPVAKRATRAEAGDYRGRTWVTRQGVFVDRMASAWLIRRFIDGDARFRFVREGAKPARGELRFDMFEGEFTHEGDRCTFEVLADRFVPNDAALRQLAEVVHDIDLKDEKFERDDAAGIERVLSAIAATYADDMARIDRAAGLFDELYALFSKPVK
ncbi:MAG TPA: chromate resistance protein ChrB domain-containing protein [Gemmatimonadaceae bacterium]|nr:chromate resistance protein ChrB domain-containing protein [Gemmatimonadaceae bacterium]